MIKSILSYALLFCVCATHTAQVQDLEYEDPEIIGALKYSIINETSGMGMSYKTDNAIWVHNDSGDGPNLYLVDTDGNLLNRGTVSGASATDWEDLSTFELNGKSYIIIGDFGDNGRNRSNYRLYIIEEPEYNSSQVFGHSYPILRTINYQYDNGKQNCESVGVDVTSGKIILFSKSHDNEIRYVYELPLSVDAGTVSLTATRIASLRTDDTTAMDISKDGHRAIVLTYKDFAYEFTREENETWAQAFNKGPFFNQSQGVRYPYKQVTMPIGRAGEESICYGKNSRDLYTMREGQGAEIYFLRGHYVEDPNSPNKAEFVSQTNVPKYIGKGETVTVSVTMKNIGTSTWTKANLYKLANTDDDDILGVLQVELDEADAIAPNQEKTFTFDIIGPTMLGVYNFQWRMMEENKEWFGEFTPRQKVVVLSSNDFFDDCDSKIDWNPGSVQLISNDVAQGAGALEFTGSAEQEYYKVFATPYDAQGTPNGTVLQFWYYVEDPTKLDAANQVEISSSGGPDVNEYSWSLSNLKAGWNFIQLNVSSASKIGTPNLSAINWFRLYRFKNGTTTTRIDGIQLIGENALSVGDIEKKINFKVFPNPATDKVQLKFSLRNTASVNISLLNIMGQIVSQQVSEKHLNPGTHSFEIYTAQLPTGTYFAKVNINNSVVVKQLIVN
ncbi:T9SS type A sorting domain-containing protein [Tamlana fucoidanivorans]|nr:T9SS type A sorting domain-containing protein [Tamlana fucoidanivorans]